MGKIEKRGNLQHRQKRDRQEIFLTALRETSTVLGAAKASGIDRGCHYLWLRNDPTYKARFEEAYADSMDRLEQAAYQRAVDGVREPVYSRDGEVVGERIKYSDTLLIFLLNGGRPERYKQRTAVEHSGNAIVKIVAAPPIETPQLEEPDDDERGTGDRYEPEDK